MKMLIQPEPFVLVIFGAHGDLTRRKLAPAVFDLCNDRFLPGNFAVIGLDRLPMSDEEFRERLKTGVAAYSRRRQLRDEDWGIFAPRLSFISGDFADPNLYAALAGQLAELDQAWGVAATRIFYLATPPQLIGVIPGQLAGGRLNRPVERARIVVEKPFGRDFDSARRLNSILTDLFEESQIYRIDHYLGKETVQNLLAFRFANSLFEPIWNRRYIDHVQITVAEEVGMGHRGGYYDQAGALRDMVQNHLMQVLCLIAMEPPVSFHADEIRNRKVDVLQAIRPIPPDQVHLYAARGQYGTGWIRGLRVPGYREEPDVAPDSPTETFAAVKIFVDNWRWQGVPFYLRTGKRLPLRVSEIVIMFQPVPHQSFPASAVGAWQPNRLAIRLQPEEGIMLRFQAKEPGQVMRLAAADMRFDYQQAFHTPQPEAYETLLLDVMQGDQTQFMRADQVEMAWRVIAPILDAWESVRPGDFPNYQAGTWGPEEAIALIARDGRNWVLPVVREEGKAEEEEG